MGIEGIRFFCLNCKHVLTPLDEDRQLTTGLCRDCWVQERGVPREEGIPTMPTLGELIVKPVTWEEAGAIVALAGWLMVIVLLLGT